MRYGQKVVRLGRRAIKPAAYSGVGRRAARWLRTRVDASAVAETNRVSRLARSGEIERIASPALGRGLVYCKLTIRGWQAYLGQDFVLEVDGDIVYGNRIERPQKGFPLEYRNIVMPKEDVCRARLSLDADFVLQPNLGTWTTPQQRAYDAKYGVKQHEHMYYSLRGNLESPSHLIVTFPGFGPSSTRISYAVSYLQFLGHDVLERAAVLAFQDRYGVAGTYMRFDSGGNPIIGDVMEEVEAVRRRLGVAEENVVLFGASKGGTIALFAAEGMPRARLLLVVPQLDLPYYFSKPFFRRNLGEVAGYWKLEQPGDLLIRYVSEGRLVDHLISYDDELSNVSISDFSIGGAGYRRYRFACGHGQVARRGLPLINSLIREAVGLGGETSIDLLDLREYSSDIDNASRLQMRLAAASVVPAKGLYFACFEEDGVFLGVELTSGANPHLAFSNCAQLVRRDVDPVCGLVSGLVVGGNGVVASTGKRSSPFVRPDGETVVGPQTPLVSWREGETYSLLSRNVREDYVLVSGSLEVFARFRRLMLVTGRDDSDMDLSGFEGMVVRSSAPGSLGLALIRRMCSAVRIDGVTLFFVRDGSVYGPIDVPLVEDDATDDCLFAMLSGSGSC